MSEVKRLARQLQGLEKELQVYLRSLKHFDSAYLEDKEHKFVKKLDLIALRSTADVFCEFLISNQKYFLSEELVTGLKLLTEIKLRSSRAIEKLELGQEVNENFTEIIEKLKRIFNE